MGWLKKLHGFESSFTKNFVKDIWKKPTRLLTGIDPFSTKLWNGVLGRDDEAMVGMFGSPGEQYYRRAEADGIDTSAARQFHTVADAVAGFFGAQGLGNVLGGAAGGGAGAGGSASSGGLGAGAVGGGAGAGTVGAGGSAASGIGAVGANGMQQVIVQGSLPAAGSGLGGLAGGLGAVAGGLGSLGSSTAPPESGEFGGEGGNESTSGANGQTSYWDTAKDWADTYQKYSGLITGVGDMMKSNQNAKYWKSELEYLKNMYAPNSPEALLMKKQMEAKDAATGRRSQYGQREIELAARLAQARAGIMTSQGYGNMAGQYRQNATNNMNGLASLDWGSIITGLAGLFGGGNGG